VVPGEWLLLKVIDREMVTWLMVAAEEREFGGILKRARAVRPLKWPGAAFSREAAWKDNRWFLIANGPGPGLVERALKGKPDVDRILSVGFCGALDPALRIGDIVVSGEVPKGLEASFVQGDVVSVDRVAVTAREKCDLRRTTGAAVVEMESAAVAKKAREWDVPFGCVRVVSDAAGEDLPLDFNRFRDADGRFERTRIALAALGSPFTVLPGLVRLDRHCRRAAERLGEFLANCEN
jgi:adenosylhomocysteine nucleosidase